MGCSLEPDPGVTEARTSVGLVRGHAYSITKVNQTYQKYFCGIESKHFKYILQMWAKRSIYLI